MSTDTLGVLAQEVGQHLEVGVAVRLGESPQAQVIARFLPAPRRKVRAAGDRQPRHHRRRRAIGKSRHNIVLIHAPVQIPAFGNG
jgi:hypothetical protein